MASVYPITFRRSARSKVFVILAAVVLLPLMTVLITALIGGGAVTVLVLAQVPEQQAGIAFLVLFPLIAVGLVTSAVRRFRRDARTAVLVYPDRLVVQTPDNQCEIPFDEVIDVRLVPKRLDAVCVVELRSGARTMLPFHIASFSIVREVFEATLVGWLATRMGQRIGEGKSVHVRESSLRAFGRLPYCAAMILVGLLVMLSIRGLLAGAMVIRNGIAHGRRGWRGRKVDFVISREGINRDPQWPSAMQRWSELEDIRLDHAGIVLRFPHGQVLSASIFAENFWPFAVWIHRAWQGRGK